MKSAVMAVACASGASAFVAPSLVTKARVATPSTVTMCEYIPSAVLTSCVFVCQFVSMCRLHTSRVGNCLGMVHVGVDGDTHLNAVVQGIVYDCLE